MSYNYLASPYTHREYDVMEQRYDIACEALVWLLDRKIWTISPIVQQHEIVKKYDMPRTYAYWSQYNKALLKDAMGLLVLTIDGWEESVGVQEEMKLAIKYKVMTKFIHRINIGTFVIRSTQ